MELRLFVAGVLLGAYTWLSRRRAVPDGDARGAALRHALFLALAGFSVALIAATVMEVTPRFLKIGGVVLSLGEALPAAFVGACAGLLGYWHARSGKPGAKRLRALLADDLEWADTIFSSATTAALLMAFVAQAFKIPSASMERTLLIGDYLFVNKFLYGARVPLTGARVLPLRAPRRGDIVVFQFPSEELTELHCGAVQYGKDFVKRLIGEPGDTVEVRAGRVLVNGKPLASEPYAVYDAGEREPESPHAREVAPALYQTLWQEHHLDQELQNNQRDFFGPVVVPPHAYFMMGDNRDHSCDSRYWGPVEEKYVKGNAWFRYWPPSRMGPL